MVKKSQSEQDIKDQQNAESTEANAGACPSDNLADETTACDSGSAPDSNAGEQMQMWKDKYARLSAEFDNYRKRTLREKMDLIASGGRDVITDMLPVLDDIDRALAAARDTDDIESVRTGTELIAHKLRGALQSRGLKEMEVIGAALDTDFHEAIARTAAPDKKMKDKIVDVVQKGYMLGDKVIRHAKVVVGE